MMPVIILLLLLIGIYVISTSNEKLNRPLILNEEENFQQKPKENEKGDIEEKGKLEKSEKNLKNFIDKEGMNTINADKLDLIITRPSEQNPTLEDILLTIKLDEENEKRISREHQRKIRSKQLKNQIYYFSEFNLMNKCVINENLLEDPQQYSYFVFNRLTKDKAEYYLFNDPISKANAVNAFAYVIEPVCDVVGDFVSTFSEIIVVNPGLLLRRGNKWIILEKCKIRTK